VAFRFISRQFRVALFRRHIWNGRFYPYYFSLSCLYHFTTAPWLIIFLTYNPHNLRNWRRRSMAHFFYHCATAPLGQGLLIFEDSWSHSDTTHSVALFWTSDQTKADLTTHKTHKRQISMPPAGFKPTIPASEQNGTFEIKCKLTPLYRGQILHDIAWNRSILTVLTPIGTGMS
jgi:hypothetical protein